MNLDCLILFQSFRFVIVNPAIQPAFSSFGVQLFGVPFTFILKFFGKLFLLFLASTVISKVFKLDKSYE
jgi:hypothetical protein